MSASVPPLARIDDFERDPKRVIEHALARGMDPALFEALRVHRGAVAKQKGVPAYVVAPNRTLTEIARLVPRSLADLELVHGMGPARLAAYGEGFLAVVRAHAPAARGEGTGAPAA